MMRFAAGVVTIALVPVMLLGAPPSQGAEGDDPPLAHPLPFYEVRDVLGDPQRERAFATGANYDAVAVLDEQGKVSRTLEGLPDATHLALDESGDTLFVTLPASREIAVVDLATATSTRHSLDGQCPDSLNFVAGLLWMSTRCDSPTRLVSFDPDTLHVEAYPIDDYVEEAVADPAAPGSMFTSGETIRRWTLEPGKAPVLAAVREQWLRSLAVSPEGDLVGSQGSGTVRVFRGSDLAPTNAYPVASLQEGAGVDGIAFAADGTMSVAYHDPRNDAAVRTYAPGETVVGEIHPLAGAFPQRNGTVYGADNLYVVGGAGGISYPRTTVLEAPSGPGAHPLGGHELLVPDFADIVAAPGAGRAFVSTGQFGNALFVLDDKGAVETVLEDMPGPTGMALSPSGRQLFVMLSQGDAIAVVDTRSLEVRRIPLPRDVWPGNLGLSSGLLWLHTRSEVGHHGHMAVDPATGRVILPDAPAWAEGALYSSPLHPDLLYALELDYSRSGSLDLWRTQGGEVPKRSWERTVQTGPATRDMDFTPDGLHALTASAAHETHGVLDARTLAVAGDPVTDDGPAAVAARSDGLVAYGTAYHDLVVHAQQPGFRRRVDVRRSTWGEVVRRVMPPKGYYYNDLMPRGLAFGKRHLYAVFGGPEKYVVRLIEMPPRHRITVTSDRQRYVPGQRARVVGHIGRGGYDEPVRFKTVSPSGRMRHLGTRPVDDSGNATIRFTFRRDVEVVGVVGTGKRRQTHSTDLAR